jgi:hypothetical protein
VLLRLPQDRPSAPQFRHRHATIPWDTVPRHGSAFRTYTKYHSILQGHITMAKPDVKFGQVYRATGKTYLDRPSAGWTVTKIFTSHDGLAYAQLINQGDSTLTKTVSLDALTDPRLFLLTARAREGEAS